MALIKADRVKESSTSTGASTFALAGAYTGFRSFSSVCSVGDTFYYVIDSDLGSEWETGLGTYSAVNTLTRTTVHSSSNSNNIVTFSAGTKNVYISLTGNQLGTLSTLAGSETLTNKTINASNNTITNVSLTSGVTGTLPLANGGTGTTTAQLAINALAGAVTSGSYLRGNGTNVVMATIAAGDVPTLNQNTTGTASGSVSGTASYVPKFTGTNVVGNSLIYDSGTNVGIGTISPSAKLHVYSTAAPQFRLEGTSDSYLSFYRNNVNGGYIGLGSPGNNDMYIYNLNSGAVRINNQAVYVTAANLVGVNEQSPAAQLHVTSAAAATKGLIVKGASAQSANLQEWQNSAGTVLATVNSAGDFTNSSGYGASEKFGSLATVLGNAATAIGSGASANFRSTAVGTNANASTIDLAVAIGSNSSVTGSGAVAIGRGSSASGTCSIAIGMFATAATDRSIAIGFSSTANGGISIGGDGTGLGYTSFNASTDNLATTGAIDVYAGDGVNNDNYSRQHSMLGTWATATYASRKGRVQLRVNDASTDREAIRYESDGANALTSIGGSAIIANTTLAVQPAVSGNKGIVVKGASGQSANLQEWQNSAGTALAVVDASGNVGIGTTSPTSKLDVNTGSGANFRAVFSTTNQVEVGNYSVANGYREIYIAGSQVAFYTGTAGGISVSERMRINASGNVGIGAASPSDKLHVIGNVRAGNYTGGGGTYLALTGDLPNYSSGLYPTLKSDGNIYLSANGKYTGYIGDSQNVFALLSYSTAGASRVLLSPDGTSYFAGGALTTGLAVGSASPSQMYAASAAATTKALVVRGASAQSANLQEWQNNAGTALATVDPAGNFYAPGGYLSGTSNAGGAFLGVSKWLGKDGEYINIRKLYGVRSFPNTYANGDYVEIAQIGRWSVQPITLTIHAGHGAVYGQAGKTYIIQSNGGDFTAAPLSSAATGDFDFDVEVVPFNTYWCKIRARRISSTAPTYADFMFTIECHNFNRTGITEVSGTGNSASALGYNSEYMRIGPNVSAPPPVGGSGAGTSLSISAASAAGTGSGGSILLQAGAYATSGSNGKVIVRGLASNTANLQEWQNNAGTALSAVKADGSIQPASMADSAATNNSIYYSTTASKLVYKDAAGTVNNLY
jgi:hypothetical protein